MSDRASASFINPLHAAPNLLTLARICLAPFLVVAVLDGHFVTGLALFIIAGLTDAFDGLLARLLKQRTALGQYLDPVADKLLLSTLFVVLTHKGLIPAQVTVLVFSRDVGILAVAAILYASVGRREFKPSILGKANTVAQILAVAAVLLAQVNGAPWVGRLRLIALDATMVLTILSGLHYAWIASRKTAHTAADGADAQSKS
jgi:cardiolipin synthase